MRLLLAAAVLAASLSPAAAGTRSLIFTPGDMGSMTPVVVLPDSTTTVTQVPVVLPADFKLNSKAYLRINLLQGSGGTCAINFGGQNMIKMRAGFVYQTGPTIASGMPTSGLADITLQDKVPRVVSYVVKGIASGAIKGLKKGDTLDINLQRVGTAIGDTCAAVSLLNVEFRYQTP